MLLTPRYGDQPIISIGPRVPGDHPVLRQRARLEALLQDLSDDEWQHPSRCEGWTVQDVVTHLVSTNGFWTLSIQAGQAGQPTRYLGAFDPVATPAQLVDQVQGTPAADTLEQLVTSNAGLAAAVGVLDDDSWDVIAEAPPGHLPTRLVADHALWDCWVHERDIVLPLGRPPVEEPDEVLTCLRYGAALGRAFEVSAGGTPEHAVGIVVRDPDAAVVVSVDGGVVRVDDGPVPSGVARCEGDAVELLEMLSRRDVGRAAPAEIDDLTAGLAVVFDQASAV